MGLTDRARIFLTAWILLSAHFATNLSREHFAAFTLAERGSLRVDEYEGLHSDLFRHADGHVYVNNNVAASFLAAVPLFLLEPLLDALERPPREAAADPAPEYRTEYPGRARFYEEVRARGLELRFGAAAALTSVLLMAPLAAWSAVLVFGFLLGRGVGRGRAIGLALGFVFATPVFFRAATLSNNLLVAFAVLGAFLLIERRRFGLAGLAAGAALALDYSGLVPLACLFLWVLARERAARPTLAFALGAVPPVLLLWWTQWTQFGNPFLPAQRWMPDAHYSVEGWRGFDWPAPDLFLANLVSPDWGLLAYGPILLLALWPARGPDVLEVPERRFVFLFSIAFLLFCAANQFARMQWNSGVRHLLPLVPLWYLAACGHLARWPVRWTALALGLSAAHVWVQSMVRFHVQPHEIGEGSVWISWQRVLSEGLQLPWLSVLRRTAPEGALVGAWFWPYLALAACAIAVAWIWRRRIRA